ncbi:MAG: NPCBM/NEW2 domain-containing protein [Bacteroidales bacterium]|nr:NPCBM/NEW2 domain-containing protein [Bacteroidales bacterium]
MKSSIIRFFLALILMTFISRTKAQEYDTIWLSSLDIKKASTGWGILGKDVSCMGKPITLNGITYKHGFGTHANSILYLSLKGGSERFSATVGIDDEEKLTTGSVIFSIYGEGSLLWRSRVLKSGGPSEKFDINVSRIDTLILLAEGAGDGINYDHADWANAYFLSKKPAPITISRPSEPAIILTPKAADTPKINGPKIYGTRPGHDFLYKIPATGVRPMSFEASGLPQGLKLDPLTGIISGKVAKAGTYEVNFTAVNSLGKAQRKFSIVAGDKIALTPPLGWNSWNCFACAIDQDKVKSAADAMLKSGLADHGWSYINIDDCWMIQSNSKDSVVGGDTRNSKGNMNVNKKFPDVKALTDYVHRQGLKIGIYSGPGPRTCAGYEGCYKHEEQDALQFARWGFDYLKYDWCAYEEIAKDHSLPELQKPYIIMNKALQNSGRDIVFSLCQYGMGDVWKWGEEVGGNCWRTTGDITDNWSSMEGIGFGQAGLEKYAGPGHWNDPDMLVVGMVGWGPKLHQTQLTPNEQYTHISLWSMLASPLLIGCDMTQMDEFTFNLLSNDEVLDINQDPLGQQASRTVQLGDLEIWTKPLEDGSIAVGLFNRGLFSSRIVAKWLDLGLEGSYMVRDVWRQKDLGVYDSRYETTLPSHGCCLLKITRK